MIVELGHFALILALVLSFGQVTAAFTGVYFSWRDWQNFTMLVSVVIFLLLLSSFVSLAYSFIGSDFSVKIVAENSHSLKPLLYKISGTWGNHEGSMLLWVLILSLFGWLVVAFGSDLNLRFKSLVVGVQSSILILFLSFLIFTSNPFERLIPTPFDGKGLNPLLQDPGLAFHPPFLYLGYVGLSISFSFAIAALIEGKIDAAWAKWVRPWTLMAWIFLTIGIAMGSWWAYYELGWGGWWFWDPVENASFMPWLTSVALLHSSIVVEKRETLKNWTVLLAILAFSFSLIGTFIVRSGVITSVHAFATDPTRGVYLLGILVFVIGGSLILYAFRSSKISPTVSFSFVSRESALVLNNLLLMVSAAIVFLGTIWPILMETFTGSKVSVGAPFFNLAFTPFMVILAMILPIGAVMPWRKGNIYNNSKPFFGVLVLSVVLGAMVWSMQTGERFLAPIGLTIAVWVVSGALVDFYIRLGDFATPIKIKLYRIYSFRGADWGKTIAHVGFGLIIFGISAITAWETEDIRVMDLKETALIDGYEFTLDKVSNVNGANYVSTMGEVSVKYDGKLITILKPEKRLYTVQNITTTEAAIDMGLLRDLYVVLGDQQENGGWVLRTYVKPFINWIWIGALVLSFGGLISLSDRRYRLGLSKKAIKNMASIS